MLENEIESMRRKLAESKDKSSQMVDLGIAERNYTIQQLQAQLRAKDSLNNQKVEDVIKNSEKEKEDLRKILQEE